MHEYVLHKNALSEEINTPETFQFAISSWLWEFNELSLSSLSRQTIRITNRDGIERSWLRANGVEIVFENTFFMTELWISIAEIMYAS